MNGEPLPVSTHQQVRASARPPARAQAGRHRAGRRRAGRPGGREGGGGAGRDRLYEIDLLRITAALAVVVYHYTFSGYARHLIHISFPALSTVTRYGYLGVDMFLTISGFVVLLSAWGRRPHEFVISRIVRMYPAYWVGVTLTAVIAVLLSRGLFTVTPTEYLANMTLLNGPARIANIDVVYWTLYVEIRFYVLVFVLAWIGITRARVIATAWLWLAATAVIEAHVLPAGPATTLDIVVQSQWSHYFIAGMALCLIYRTGFSWQLGAILVLSYANAVYQAINFANRVSARYDQPLHATVVAGVVTFIFVVMTLIALRVTRRLGRPWFVVAGTLTYPLYLVHSYIGFTLINLVGGRADRWVLVPGMIIVMCAAAYAIHRQVEVRMAPRLKRSLQRLAARADRWLPGDPRGADSADRSAGAASPAAPRTP